MRETRSGTLRQNIRAREGRWTDAAEIPTLASSRMPPLAAPGMGTARPHDAGGVHSAPLSLLGQGPARPRVSTWTSCGPNGTRASISERRRAVAAPIMARLSQPRHAISPEHLLACCDERLALTCDVGPEKDVMNPEPG